MDHTENTGPVAVHGLMPSIGHLHKKICMLLIQKVSSDGLLKKKTRIKFQTVHIAI
jgi:hypothetical protein